MVWTSLAPPFTGEGDGSAGMRERASQIRRGHAGKENKRDGNWIAALIQDC